MLWLWSERGCVAEWGRLGACPACPRVGEFRALVLWLGWGPCRTAKPIDAQVRCCPPREEMTPVRGLPMLTSHPADLRRYERMCSAR